MRSAVRPWPADVYKRQEYAGRFAKEAMELGVEFLMNSMVLEVNEKSGCVLCTSREHGITTVQAGSIVLAMGCRERTRAMIQIPGSRPAGIYTAGTAQRLINRQNEMVGRKIVILGSGDIGMIMARRMTLEGAEVLACLLYTSSPSMILSSADILPEAAEMPGISKRR